MAGNARSFHAGSRRLSHHPRLDMWSNFDDCSTTKHNNASSHEETRQVELRFVVGDKMERRVSYENVGLVIRTRPKEWLHSIALDDMLV